MTTPVELLPMTVIWYHITNLNHESTPQVSHVKAQDTFNTFASANKTVEAYDPPDPSEPLITPFQPGVLYGSTPASQLSQDEILWT